MTLLRVEKLGGLAGFGGSRARIRSQGQIDTSVLSAADQKRVDALFQAATPAAPGGADAFRFRISRTTSAGTESVEAAEAHVPAAVTACVKDELV